MGERGTRVYKDEVVAGFLPSCQDRITDRGFRAGHLQTVIFFSSLFGDLIESIIKRDAGMKVGPFLTHSCRCKVKGSKKCKAGMPSSSSMGPPPILQDSGDLIPGHGGLLDRFDSYMFTGATTYFYIVFVLPYIL